MLSSTRTAQILEHLGCRVGRPNLTTLSALMYTYVRRVPWESAFRIVRKDEGRAIVAARSPDEFWADAVERGGGGTCFESNYAFFALLRSLGFHGYLTLNNMGESVGCHTAIVVELEGQHFLVDVGIPLHRPLLLNPSVMTRCRASFHYYFARPEDALRYTIERSRHPKRYIFTLIDRPVSDAAYIAASNADYGDQGLFLDRVIINKVIGNTAWRFNSGEQPYCLQGFSTNARRRVRSLPEEGVADVLAHHFGMDFAIIERALRLTNG